MGSPIAATDPDDDALTYSLSGTDSASFEIGSSTGQITTKPGVTYDYEAKSSYSLQPLPEIIARCDIRQGQFPQ